MLGQYVLIIRNNESLQGLHDMGCINKQVIICCLTPDSFITHVEGNIKHIDVCIGFPTERYSI